MRTIRAITASATLLALSITACSSGDIAAPVDASRQKSAASAVVERPWKADCTVDARFTSGTTLTIEGTCQMAHLGRTTVLMYQTVSEAPGGFAYTNTTTYTAANGDELRTTGVGMATFTPTGLSLAGTETAAGGSGRFANASGSATQTGAVQFVDPSTTTGNYSAAGRLTY